MTNAPVGDDAPGAGLDRDARGRSISLALVSHTNAGKTTLARTLLGRDVGEVRDAPHVTEFSDAHTLVEAEGGERLVLWDTPGFGDSVRLAKRLRLHANPIGRFLGELWDRWLDRPMWSAQQALRTVRDDADALLYLVNASESIESAGYVKPEMEILAWVGKPVVVLLNQLGAPRERSVESAEVERWRQALAASPVVRAVLPLDAFARCWVQELTLLASIEAALPDEKRATMQRLRAAWRATRLATFDRAMAVLAEGLAKVAAQSETLPQHESFGARLRSAGAVLGRTFSGAKRRDEGTPADIDPQGPTAQARRALVDRLDTEVRSGTHALIAMHGLGGRAEREILDRLASGVDVRIKVDEKQAAAWGGAVTGAIAGLKADILSGGLTLGGGMLAGGLIGALGGAGVARAANLVRGTDRSTVAWNTEALDAMVEAAVLRYLAVAHFGRGRGEWKQGEFAPHWKLLVSQAIVGRHDALAGVWELRGPAGAAEADAAAAIARAVEPILRDATLRVLGELYPDAPLDGAQPPA